MADLKTFRDLVTWATWTVLEGITRGERLHSVVQGVLIAAIQWSQEQQKAKDPS